MIMVRCYSDLLIARPIHMPQSDGEMHSVGLLGDKDRRQFWCRSGEQIASRIERNAGGIDNHPNASSLRPNLAKFCPTPRSGLGPMFKIPTSWDELGSSAEFPPRTQGRSSNYGGVIRGKPVYMTSLLAGALGISPEREWPGLGFGRACVVLVRFCSGGLLANHCWRCAGSCEEASAACERSRIGTMLKVER